jgi:hypothetical protein
MPASVAGCWPKLRLNQTGRTHACARARSRMVASEVSGPLSWTSSTSVTRSGRPSGVLTPATRGAISSIRAGSVAAP